MATLPTAANGYTMHIIGLFTRAVPPSPKALLLCGFTHPDRCQKTTTFLGAHADYRCGASDITTDAETGAFCERVNITFANAASIGAVHVVRHLVNATSASSPALHFVVVPLHRKTNETQTRTAAMPLHGGVVRGGRKMHQFGVLYNGANFALTHNARVRPVSRRSNSSATPSLTLRGGRKMHQFGVYNNGANFALTHNARLRPMSRRSSSSPTPPLTLRGGRKMLQFGGDFAGNDFAMSDATGDDAFDASAATQSDALSAFMTGG